MPLELSQFMFFIFVAAILITAYEMRVSLRPPVCPECAHCRAALEEARRREELMDRYEPPHPIRRDDEERRH